MNFQPIRFDQAEALKSGGNNDFFEPNSEQRVKITRAEFVTTSTGSESLIIDVINNDKKRGFFALNYGSNEFAYRHLQSLMGVCGVTDLTPTQMTVPKYDVNTKQIINVACINAKELIGKVFVGLFVTKYSFYQGAIKQKTELYVPFNTNRQTYNEMVDNLPAQEIERLKPMMLNTSNDSKMKAEEAKNGNGGYNPMMGGNSGVADDIPESFGYNGQSTTYRKNPLPNQAQQPINQPPQNLQANVPPAVMSGQQLPTPSGMTPDDDIPF